MDAATTGSMGGSGKLEPKRLVGMFYFVFALAAGAFLHQIAELVLTALRVQDRQLFGIDELTLSAVLGFGVAIAIAVVGYLNPKVHAVSIDIATELKRVTWPSLAETRVSTVAVIIASVVSALVLFGFDFISSKVMTVWVPAGLKWIAKI